MKPTKPKSLGQIAYESRNGPNPWRIVNGVDKRLYHRIARAVEREVLKRQKGRKK